MKNDCEAVLLQRRGAAFSSGALAHLRPEPLAVAHVVLSAPIFAKEHVMNNIIWLVGAVVIVIAILSFLGLR